MNGTDYTASNGSDVVLTTGATTGDNLEVVSYSTYEVNAQTYTGGLTAKNDGAAAITANRLTSDGTILDLKKDGTTVGVVGAGGGNLFLTSGVSGFGTYADGIAPATSVGTFSAGTKDLGSSSIGWRNLYLSGGVYLGGTGSANKLDDYEEGTWVATAVSGISGVSSSTSNNRYTKIGNIVSVIGEMATFTGQTSDVLEIGGLPYAVGSNYESSFSILHNSINLDAGYTQVVGYAKAGSAAMRLYEVGDNVAYSALRGDQMGSGSFLFQMTYHTI